MTQVKREGFITVSDSIELFYRIVGSSPDTVVVLHGGPGFPLNYLEPDLAPLALSHTLLFYDQRAAGDSRPIITDTTVLHWRNYVDDLEAVRRHFGLERITLIGHSWGGALAALYAKEHPEHVERLLLLDPGPSPFHDSPYFEQFKPRERLDQRSLEKLREADVAWGAAPDSTKKCWDYYSQFGKGYTSNPRYIRQTWGDVCNLPQEVMGNPARYHVIRALGEYDWRKDLQRVSAPALVLHGEDDPIPVGVAREWAEALPNSQLVVIEESGHFPFYERPEAFFPITKAFLDGSWPVPERASVNSWPPAPAPSQSSFARAWWEITAAHAELEAAIASQDPDRAVANYTEDVIFFAPTAPPISGRRQLRAFFRDTFDKGVRSAKFETLDLEGNDQHRIESGRYTLRGDGGRILDMGKYMVFWVNEDGQWKAHRDIFNTTRETPSPLYEYDLQMMNTDVLGVLDEYFEGLLTEDMDRIQLADDVLFVGPTGYTLRGSADVKPFLANTAASVEAIHVHQSVVDGDYACKITDYDWANGATTPLAICFRVVDGEIAEIRPYFDPRPLQD